MKRFGIILALIASTLAFSVVPAAGETISVSQTITITARVADMRSIIVNQKGQMTTIYSNTAVPVEPVVYQDSTSGKQLALTPELRKQYDQIITKQRNMVGVKIPVALPVANALQARTILLTKISANTLKNFIKF